MKTITELMPITAAPTSKANPVVVPARVKSPAVSPVLSVLAMIKDMFGPGVSPNSRQAAMKAKSTSTVMVDLLPVSGGAEICVLRQSPNGKSRPPQAPPGWPAHVNFMGGDDPNTLEHRML